MVISQTGFLENCATLAILVRWSGFGVKRKKKKVSRYSRSKMRQCQRPGFCPKVISLEAKHMLERKRGCGAPQWGSLSGEAFPSQLGYLPDFVFPQGSHPVLS